MLKLLSICLAKHVCDIPFSVKTTFFRFYNDRGVRVIWDEILKVYKLLYKQVYKSKWYFKKHTIQPALLEGYVEMIYPDKPNHPKQKYRLTAKGIALKNYLTNNK